MPFGEALFWIGVTVAGTGVWILWERLVKSTTWSLIFTALGVLAIAYSLYLPSHPNAPNPPVWIPLLVLTWAVFGYLAYNRKYSAKFRQAGNSLQEDQASLTIPGEAFNAAEYFRTAYYSSLQSEVEARMRAAAIKAQPNDREAFYLKFIGTGVIQYIYDMLWLRVYRSQLALLLELNRNDGRLPLSRIKAHYDAAALENPNDYEHYSFDQWTGFMVDNGMIIKYPSDMIEITVRGKDFLKYLLHWGREITQRHL